MSCSFYFRLNDFIGTLTKNIGHAVKAAINNVPFKIDKKAGLMHLKVGLISKFSQAELEQNINAVFKNISPFGKNTKKFVESAHLCVSSEQAVKMEPPRLTE